MTLHYTEIKRIENEIDEAFNNSKLLSLGYTQAIWTLLSVLEDHHFKIQVYNPLDENNQKIYIDGLINAVTYPLRICHNQASVTSQKLKRALIDDDYKAANEWISRAEDYNHFCSIFPLYYNKEIELQISGNRIITTDWSAYDLSYEAYDRFVEKRNSENEETNDLHTIASSIFLHTKVKRDSFTLNFTPKLVKEISLNLENIHEFRFSLPKDWNFNYFSIKEFKVVFTTIQSMAYGWFIARQIAWQKGISSIGFKSALWTPGKLELINRLVRYTGLSNGIITKIVEYLTFGAAGIRDPDIAIQPIVDLKNGEYGISPFIWLNVNSERNLCVLLNQIHEEKKIYSRLINRKEDNLRNKIIKKLDGLDFEFKHGKLYDTDVDLSIIDHNNKKCLTLELKWFIEPAEIREVIQRSQEIQTGVDQAKKILSAWQKEDKHLIIDILGVNTSYDFLAIVASVSSIGNYSVQDDKIPIIKIWHLIDEILKQRNLGHVMEWLKDRKYLPKQDVDFKIEHIDIQSGNWHSKWYGISYV